MTYEERLKESRLFSLKKSRLTVSTKSAFKHIKIGCRQEEHNQFPTSSGNTTENDESGLPRRLLAVLAFYPKINCPFLSVYGQPTYNP